MGDACSKLEGRKPYRVREGEALEGAICVARFLLQERDQWCSLLLAEEESIDDMTGLVFDAREIPVEWVLREYRQVCGSSCSVGAQGQEGDEEMQHAGEESWWSTVTSYATSAQQLTLTTSLPGLNAEATDCTVHPLALGCDGLLVILAFILGVLFALKAGVHTFQHRLQYQNGHSEHSS